jgi:hypothetical protein
MLCARSTRTLSCVGVGDGMGPASAVVPAPGGAPVAVERQLVCLVTVDVQAARRIRHARRAEPPWTTGVVAVFRVRCVASACSAVGEAADDGRPRGRARSLRGNLHSDAVKGACGSLGSSLAADFEVLRMESRDELRRGITTVRGSCEILMLS